VCCWIFCMSVELFGWNDNVKCTKSNYFCFKYICPPPLAPKNPIFLLDTLRNNKHVLMRFFVHIFKLWGHRHHARRCTIICKAPKTHLILLHKNTFKISHEYCIGIPELFSILPCHKIKYWWRKVYFFKNIWLTLSCPQNICVLVSTSWVNEY